MGSGSDGFMEQLCAAIEGASVSGETQVLIERAIVDTLAVAAAGFTEPEVRICETVFAGGAAPSWSGAGCESVEAAILVNGIASHVLDYDDLLPHAGHLSAILVPALLSAGGRPERGALTAAYGAGILAGRAVGRKAGPGLNQIGWHATGILGAIASAAAVGRLRQLDRKKLRSALALAGAQAGGLRVNFGTMGKPAHAGFAAAAGYRAVRMAEAGIEAAPDIFCENGFTDTYGIGDGDPSPDAGFFVPRPDLIIVKLYPCCYASHRLIRGAIELHQKLGKECFLDPSVEIEVTVPPNMMRALIYDRPRSGLEAKFSARQPIAIGLIEGALGIDHFTDAVTERSDLRALAERVQIVVNKEAPPDAHPDSFPVHYAIRKGDRVLAEVEILKVPGSRDDPPSLEAMRHKIADCIRAFERQAGVAYPMLGFVQQTAGLSDWLA